MFLQGVLFCALANFSFKEPDFCDLESLQYGEVLYKITSNYVRSTG